jgi:hypothetical protein
MFPVRLKKRPISTSPSSSIFFKEISFNLTSPKNLYYRSRIRYVNSQPSPFIASKPISQPNPKAPIEKFLSSHPPTPISLSKPRLQPRGLVSKKFRINPVFSRSISHLQELSNKTLWLCKQDCEPKAYSRTSINGYKYGYQ